MGNLLRPGCVLVLLSALHCFSIASTSVQRYDDKAISPAYMISKKTCYAKGQSGTCMFVWECMKTEGNAIGMCVEGFMFGSCCSHDIDNNLVPNKRPTLPPVVKPAIASTSTLATVSSSNRPTETTSTMSTTQPSTSSTWFYPTSSSSISAETVQNTAHPNTATTTVTATSPSTTAESVTKEMSTNSTTTSTTTTTILPTTSVSPNAGSPTVTSSTSPKPTKIRTKPTRRPTTKKPSNATTIGTSTTPLNSSSVTAEVPVPSTVAPSSPSTANITLSSSTTPSTTTIPVTPSTSTASSTALSSPIPISPVPPVETSTTSTSTSTTSPATTTTTTTTATTTTTTMTMTTSTTTVTTPTSTSTAAVISALPSSIAVSTTPSVDESLITQNPSNSTLTSTSSNNNASTSTEGATNSSSTSRPPINVTSLPISNPSIECGIPPLFARQEGTARIVGGTNAKFGSWPWQVSVRRTSFFGFSSTHRCGGALLNELWVVTAGHCVEDLLVTQIRLRLGEFDFSSVQEPFPFVERGVNKKVVHPKYNFFTYEYDLALVRLEEPVEFMPNIAPICLPATDDLLIGENGTVTGWGRLSEGGTLPSMLQQVTVPIVSNDKCKDMFLRAGRNEYIPEIFMCAGYEQGGRDSCQGDSGGPLQVRGRDGRYFLAGIISWGIGCAEANLPGVCTRISKFTNWILENVT